MEDSEKRRERLKAMRIEAAQAEASSYVETSAVSGSLRNPLLESPAAMPAQEVSFASPRFDFYTDPMAAFSSNKRSAAANQAAQKYFTPSNSGSHMAQFSSPRPGSRTPSMTPSPAHQMQSHYSPNQRMYQVHGPYNSAASHSSPGSGPFPSHQGTPDSWGGSGHFADSSASYRGPYPVHEGSPGFQPRGSPSFNSGRGRGPLLGNSPSIGVGHGGNATYSGRHHRQWHGGSKSQFSGQSGGRGRGFYSHGSATDEVMMPESFYHKSMFEDPWQHLEPVVWRGLDTPANNMHTPGSSNSWLPKSISTKKARVSEPSNKCTPQQSLAEYLATSFNEAATNTPSV